MRRLVVLKLMFCFIISPIIARSNVKTLERPKLVVGIVVDQMRYDYLFRYYNQYVEGGMRRLIDDGFNCRNNHYSYALTKTGPGHASIYTGSIPAINGIVDNSWYDRNLGRSINCVEDSNVRIIGSSTESLGGRSAKNLLTSTLTDQLRIATNFRSKTIGIGIKDRAAILPAGHSANGAYWFDSKTGNWVTSSYYMEDLPKWLKNYNSRKMPAEYIKKGWSTLYPLEFYDLSTHDEVHWEGKLGGMDPVFPYDLSSVANDSYGIITGTPWGNTITKEMAIEAIKGENLGKGKETDFLAISFSSPDAIGHRTGPHSIEQQDNYLRLDQDLASFFTFLDGWVGEGSYTVFLTADHGVVDVPGFATEKRLPGGLVNHKEVNISIEQALEKNFGKGELIIHTIENNQFYLDHELLKEKNITVNDVTEVIREAILPIPGIADVINLRDLNNVSMNSYLLELYRNTINLKRSGDVQIIPEPNYLHGGGATGTNHGTPYNYDTHVPFLLYGWGIKKGETFKRTYVSDIAPTISSLLYILPPSGTIGNTVAEALDKNK